LATYDPNSAIYYTYLSNIWQNNNNVGATFTLNMDFSQFNLTSTQIVSLSEVSTVSAGGVVFAGTLSALTTFLAANPMPSFSNWLFTLPSRTQIAQANGSNMLVVTASLNTQLNDGAAASVAYSDNGTLKVRSSVAGLSQTTGTAINRFASLIKFTGLNINPTTIQAAYLSVYASSITATIPATTLEAHVYGLNDDTWTQSSTWTSSTSILLQGVAADPNIANNVVTGQAKCVIGVASCTSWATTIVGQMTVTGPSTKRIIDVTDYIKHKTTTASFLIAQENRRDTPTLAANAGGTPTTWVNAGNYGGAVNGDTQSDGIQIVSIAGATAARHAPQLWIVTAAAAPTIPSPVLSTAHITSLTQSTVPSAAAMTAIEQAYLSALSSSTSSASIHSVTAQNVVSSGQQSDDSSVVFFGRSMSLMSLNRKSVNVRYKSLLAYSASKIHIKTHLKHASGKSHSHVVAEHKEKSEALKTALESNLKAVEGKSHTISISAEPVSVSTPGTCSDKVKNGQETDVDCGGNTGCPQCAGGKMCLIDSDCKSTVCHELFNECGFQTGEVVLCLHQLKHLAVRPLVMPLHLCPLVLRCKTLQLTPLQS
jgi:hypothetical protein